MTSPLGLYTDLYEVRMVESYLARGMTADATFSLYIRPTRERPWFIASGLAAAVETIEAFAYGPEQLDYLRSLAITESALRELARLRPSGEVWAVREGTVVLADEPLLEVTAPLPFAQLIETAVINVVQLPTLVATKAARVALAARGRPVVDFGFRRAHGLDTGVEAARAAYVGGGLATSNLEAGRRYAIPVVGTMAHSFVLAFADEADALRAFAADHPDDCVLLVDTYDTIAGVRKAIEVARGMKERGAALRGVRLDSGDLDELSRAARVLLDEAGLPEVRILASGGLDETHVARLVDAGAPIDGFGVGTDLVVSSDRPAADIAYKLVAYDGRPVAKRSPGKRSLPGAKQVFRTSDPRSDVLGLRAEELDGERLLVPVWRDGRTLADLSLESARARAREQLDTLPRAWRTVRSVERPPVPVPSAALAALATDAT